MFISFPIELFFQMMDERFPIDNDPDMTNHQENCTHTSVEVRWYFLDVVLCNPSTPTCKSANTKNLEKYKISFCKILKNKWYQAKVLLKRFHLNGHTIGFCQQTQKLEQMAPCKSTAEEVSFEWSHHRISSTDSKVRTNGTMQKYC